MQEVIEELSCDEKLMEMYNKIGRENVRCAVANNPFDVYNLLCQILEDYRGTHYHPSSQLLIQEIMGHAKSQ